MNPLLLEALLGGEPVSAGWNPLKSTSTLTGTNKETVQSSGYARSTVARPLSGFWWAELLANNPARFRAGFANQNAVPSGDYPGPANGDASVFIGSNQTIYYPGGSTAGSVLQLTTGDVLGIGIDFTANAVKFRKNNESISSITGYLPTSGAISVAIYSDTGMSVTLRTRAADFAYAIPSGATAWM